MSKLQRRTVTAPVLPNGIREAMLPIDTAFRNQLLDKDNFDTYGTAISTLKITDNMTDLPSSGKLFEGKLQSLWQYLPVGDRTTNIDFLNLELDDEYETIQVDCTAGSPSPDTIVLSVPVMP